MEPAAVVQRDAPRLTRRQVAGRVVVVRLPLRVAGAALGIGMTATALLTPARATSARTAAPQTTSAQPSPPGRSTNLGRDANGNPLRLAIKTGHVSNYYETQLRPYTLPDPLRLSDGTLVRDRRTWLARRRPEILRVYETAIYGRVPNGTPRVRCQVTYTDPQARGGTPVAKLVIGRIGDWPDAPPSSPEAGGTQPSATRISSRTRRTAGPASSARRSGRARPSRPPDEWGAITAWAWGVSRALDYLQTDPAIDAKHIALHGHSRLGKTALGTSARDDRIAAVYASCPGELGASLARRDWGETVDDLAQTFPFWFAGNFQQWVGRWNDMPVDAHMPIALSAPRPVFITGGTADQWADPVGEFLAEVAAGPVYRLLGARDLGTSQLPPLDVPVTSGDLGWHYHTGGHAATAADWNAFLLFFGKYLRR